MKSVVRCIASGVLLTFLFVATAYAQGIQTGSITGVVSDQKGGVVAGASVEVVSEATGASVRSLTTDSDGRFTVTLLPPGTYRLEITASNFKKAVVAGVKAEITGTTRQDVSLEAGQISESVTIESAPTLINTENATTGQALTSAQLQTLPLASPNFLFLLSLSTGVTGEPTDVRTAGRGSADVTVNGQRTSNNSVTLEGINVNDFNLAHFDTVPLPNPSTLQEMKVATSLYDASQGSKGGGALGLVIKSGQKDFHGELYWLHRNDALNANEYFRNASGLSKRGRLLQNVFGGSASGPIPKAGGFWFFNYQGVRARNGIDPNGSTTRPISQVFPTNSDGTTSAALLAPVFFTPATGITAANIDPVAVKVLNLTDTRFGGNFLVPRPGVGGCPNATGTASFTCFFSAIAPIEDNQYTISYDRSWRSGNDKISGRWFWDEGDVTKPFGTDTSLSNPRTDTQWNRFLSLTHTHIFSATKVNELRAGYSRFIFANIPDDLHALSEIGATRGNSDQFPGMYRIAVTGRFTIGTGVNDDRGTVSNTYNLVDTFSMVLGKHSLRMGGEAVQYQLNRFNNFAVRGAITTGSTTGTTPPSNCPTCVNNNFSAFQNFLLGRVTAIQSAFGDPARNFIATDFAGFIQDDYRWSNRLTFNIGLRWEAMSFGRDKLYRAGVFDPARAAAGLNPFLIPERVNLAGFTGTPGVRACALERCRDDNNFAPRFGFAWDISGNQKTVVRGGYGIYYQRLSNQNILQNSLAAPFTVQPLSTTSNPLLGGLANPFGTIPPPSIIAAAFIPQASRFAGLFNATSSTVNGVAPGGISANPADVNNPAFSPRFINEAGQACLNYGGTATNCSINLASFTSAPLDAYTPYTQQWNLTVQRELWKGWAVEMGYVGSHYIGGIGIWDPFLAKLASPGSPITVRDINGVTYNITTNTVGNEELRHQVLGLSRKRGSRYSGNIGVAKYNSFQATLSRRLNRGLYFQAAYTYSKTMDNVSGSLSTDELNATRAGQGGGNIFNQQDDPRQNYTRGDFDRPHRLVVSYAYDIPVPRNSFFHNQIFKGWTISGIVTYQSGLPFSITDANSGTAFGGGTGTGLLICRPAFNPAPGANNTTNQLPASSGLPNCTPGAVSTIQDAIVSGRIQSILGHYLNPNFISTAQPVPNGASDATGYGNVPRNAFRGPFQQNWDVSLIKAFRIKEKHNIQFRMDMFNVWNHPVFRFPSVVALTSPDTFGQITETAVPARLIQFGLRYSR